VYLATADPQFATVMVSVFSGLALFLFGMSIMTDALRTAASESIRKILNTTTKTRGGGYALGATLGFSMHSSSASVMTIGFINAGLLTMTASLPVIYGLNLGTTLSMQLISFRLTDLAHLFIAVGFFGWLLLPHGRMRTAIKALLGFGMLFLGIAMMSDAIYPYREELGSLLSGIKGNTWHGMLLGILIAALITGIIQSSGAVIGMCFVMIDAGAITSLYQVYPIILGAHIGTSVTGLLASIGANIEARRAAVANLTFQLCNVSLGVLLAKPIIYFLQSITSDVVHQAAHAHTLVMLLAGLLFFPFVQQHANLMRFLVRSRFPTPEPSHLNPFLLDQPESALRASMLELRRSIRLCSDTLQTIQNMPFPPDAKSRKRISLNEDSLDQITNAVRHYHTRITDRYLSRRQALMIQYLNRTATNLERIGDHLETLLDLSLARVRERTPAPDLEAQKKMNELLEMAQDILQGLYRSLNPDYKEFASVAEELLRQRDRFNEKSEAIEIWFNKRVATHKEHPITGLYYSEAILAANRLVRHVKVIALEMKQPYFGFKERKIGRVAPPGKVIR